MRYFILSVVTLITIAAIPCQWAATPWLSKTRGSRLTLVFAGDLILHPPLQRQGQRQGLQSLWKQALPLLRQADFACINVEGPIASGVDTNGHWHPHAKPWDTSIYTGYPRFNYPPALITALHDSHVTMISNANNHSLDRFAIGVDKTYASIVSAGLTPLGIQPRTTPYPWHHLTHRHGITLAWIDCTTSTNGMRDRYHQVQRCDQRTITQLIHQLHNKADAVIVLPHWGSQYQFNPSRQQRQLAKAFVNAGALLVIGTHPHVLQPLTAYRATDQHQALIAYSLGNFVSNQGTPKNRTTVLLQVTLNHDHHHTTIAAVNAIPAYMINRNTKDSIHLRVAPINRLNQTAQRILRKTIPASMRAST